MQNDSLFRPIEKWFWGKKWKIWPPGQIDHKGTHPPPKHVFGRTERKSMLLRVSCGRIEGTKFFLKSTRGYNFSHMPTPPPIFGGHHILHVGRTVDINTRARFQVNRFRGLGAPGAENDHPHWLGTSPLHSVRTNVLHCDIPY